LSNPNESLIVPTVGGTFFPLRVLLGLDEHGYSSSILEQIVTASARFASFRDATFALQMSGIDISERQVIRVAHQIAEELIDQRDQKVLNYLHRQLSSRTEVLPEAVVVEIDGGRIRTRSAQQGPGVHEAQNKEDKIAALVTLQSQLFPSDPQSQPPESFQKPRRVVRLVQQMKGQAPEANGSEIPEANFDPAEGEGEIEAPLRWSPKRLVRTCVASLETSRSFGPMLAAEAMQRNFYSASRRAFVADGMAYNWVIQQGYFGDFEPIVDFLHVVCYLYSAAQAVNEEEASSWSQYLVWMRGCWQGQVREVLRDLDEWQSRLGLPPPKASASVEESRDPRRVIAEARSYLRNNQERMDYPRYRKEGLPITSSLVESLVGEFNARVKSKQKYWNRPQGAESILQLRAALLSEDNRLSRYFAQRAGNPFRKKRTLGEKSIHQNAQNAA
jgi:hypothetical protein